MPAVRPVLVIEDSLAQGRIVARLLEGQGCAPRVCGSAAETRAIPKVAPPPQCVLVDLHLGDANGVQLMAELRARWPWAPIVMMTADSRNDFGGLARAREHGADLLLRKPFGEAELADILADVDALRRDGRRRRHVLMVDDSAVVCRTLARFLDPTRYRVLSTQDPKQILLRLNYDHVDVVLTDMMMPDMSGRQIIDLVRSVWPSVPVIAMSGDAAVLAEAVQCGADAYLRKPFAASELVAAIDTALAGAAAAPPPADEHMLDI